MIKKAICLIMVSERMNIAVIGCGTMGEALGRHFAKKHTVVLCDRKHSKSEALAKEIGGLVVDSAKAAIGKADVIFLAVKPKDFHGLAKESKAAKSKLIISILAGIDLGNLKKSFPSATVVRCMPSLSLISGEGVIGLVDDKVLPAKAKTSVESLLHGLGMLAWMSEEKLESFTALSGSGIAFILVMIEAMMESGVFLGFTAQESREFVLRTFEGAVALMRHTGKHPAELKLQVCSPAGTTIAGLRAMEEKAVRSGIMDTVIACYERALSIGKSVKG